MYFSSSTRTTASMYSSTYGYSTGTMSKNQTKKTDPEGTQVKKKGKKKKRQPHKTKELGR